MTQAPPLVKDCIPCMELTCIAAKGQGGQQEEQHQLHVGAAVECSVVCDTGEGIHLQVSTLNSAIYYPGSSLSSSQE